MKTWLLEDETLSCPSENMIWMQFWCLMQVTCPWHHKANLLLWNKLCIINRPQNIRKLRTILFHHLNNAASLILVQFPPSRKLSGPFIWAEAERGTLSGNRCSGCLMLACGGPAGLETWSNRDPILETHNTHLLPPSCLMKQPGAKNTRSCVE